MAERVSAVVPGKALCSGGVAIAPHEPAELWLIALWPGSFLNDAARELGLPNRPGAVAADGETVRMAVALGRWLIEAPPGTPPPVLKSEMGSVTGLGHGLSGFTVSGPNAPLLMRKMAPVDLELPRHAPPCVVRTASSHSVALTMRREADDRFVLYVERTYGLDFLDFLVAEVKKLGLESSTTNGPKISRPQCKSD